MQLPVSVVTIVKNRTEKLCHLIQQLEQCAPLPAELVIVWMSPPSDLSLVKSDKFDIVHKFVNIDDLPIARARNKGLTEAKYDALVYMNVDAICAPNFIAAGFNALRNAEVVHTQVKTIASEYWDLPHDAVSTLQPQQTAANTSAAPNGSTQNNLETSNSQDNDHGKYSNDTICSTVFFISKTNFEKTGGFDEGYNGFGLNDEDFFTNCRTLGFSIHSLPINTYVPSRPNDKCPLNHLIDFVKNTKRFYAKWGHYPRPDILDAYAEAGYVNHNYREEGLHVLCVPDAEETSNAAKERKPVAALSATQLPNTGNLHNSRQRATLLGLSR